MLSNVYNMLYLIKSRVSFTDARIIQEWILKLEKGSDCPDMKATRNEYARYLVHQLQRQSLHRPFTKQPPEGPLLPLSQVLVTYKDRSGFSKIFFLRNLSTQYT